MDFEHFLQTIRADPHYAGQIAHVERLPARSPRYAEPAQPLPAPLPGVLASLGIERLYTHQAQAIDLARAGQDRVIVTSTASGKTLCYNLPVLEALLKHPHRRALYLYPTKALAQDQHKALRRLLDAAPELANTIKCGVYDGDTPQTTRRKLRDEAQVVLSNPDMLHSGILPYHTRWSRFWANLDTVVIDEVHTYRGIFGSHVANVLRRLQRVCDQYGSRPRFVCCSATIANPAEHAARLVGRDLALITDDGSPKGEKWFVFWNPPRPTNPSPGETTQQAPRTPTLPSPLDRPSPSPAARVPGRGEGGEVHRQSSNVEAERLMVSLIRQGVPTLAFGRARIVAELLYRYVREQLQREGSPLARAISPYRGGYLPAERREIERRLFNGELLGVTSTNALELGIDVGGLDAVLIIGFPGTIASAWQQAGRAGRGTEPSIVFFIAYNDPTDQFIIRRPEFILGRSPEHAVIDPENPYILAGHLGCAAAEMPLRAEDARYFGPRTTAIADALADDGQLRAANGVYFWAQPQQPSHRVGLRIQSDNTYTIIETTGGSRVIGQVDAISAPELVYPEAIYLHEGHTHFVERLDTLNKVAHVRREDTDYYTQAILESLIRIKGTDRQKQWGTDASTQYGQTPVVPTSEMPQANAANEDRPRFSSPSPSLWERGQGGEGPPPASLPPTPPAGPPVSFVPHTRICYGEVDVTWATVGFKKIQFYSMDSLGWGKVDLPPQTLTTTGVWLLPSDAIAERVRAAGGNPVEGLAGIRSAAVHLFPLYAMCDKADIGGQVDSMNTGAPTLFLYDRYAGGLGFTEIAYDRMEELLQACLTLILECDCRDGCPACVGVPNLRPPIHMDPDAGGGFPLPSKEAALLMLRSLLEEASLLIPTP